MPDIRLRPRFRRDIACPPRALLGVLSTALSRPDARVTGTVFESSAVLKVRPDEVHFWSPQLQLSLEPCGDGATVHGLFGPHPTVWSMFVGLYVAIGFATAMGAMFGCAQWILGRTPWTLWAIPAGIVLSAVVWGAGRTGRSLGFDQVRVLYDFVQVTMNECESAPPGE